MSYAARLDRVRRVPLYRSSFALMLTTGLNGLLGFAYWILAARLYPAKAVGIGAGAISAMTLVSSLGWVGLQYVLLRYVPVAGRAQTRLVRLSYLAGIGIALAAAGIFLAGFARLAGLGILTKSPLTALLFAVSIVLWVVFSLQDPVLIGLRRAGWVPIENAAFGAVKAALLVGFAASASAWAIFGAWTLGLVAFVLIINVALFGRLLRREQGVPSQLPPQRQLVRFATGHHFVAVTAALPDSLVSLLVLAFMPGAANAYYYSAWAVSFSLRLLAVNMCNALIVEGALAETQVRSLVRQVSRLALAVVIPLVVVVVLGAGPIMRAFGPQYAQAANLLRLFAVALIPFTILSFVIAVERIRERAARALLIAGASTLVTIGLDVWLIPSVGLTGAGWGWLAGQLVGAVIAVGLTLRRDPAEPSVAAEGRLDFMRRRRQGMAPGSIATGVSFAEAAEEYLRFAEQDRGCKPSTIRGYRAQLNAHLLPVFGSMRIEDITEREIERWRAGMVGSRKARPVLSNKTKNHQLVLMHAILRRAVKLYGLPRNPLANVDRYRVRASGDIEAFSPEEIWALVRAAASDIDGTIYLTAAFTGLRRRELLGLRWRDIDFEASTIRVRASYAAGKLTTPKSGKVRAVPMAPDVAAALARIGQRDRFTGEDEFVFAGESGLPLNGDALSSRYERALDLAGLRRLRFHDLRHTFGTRMIREADIRRVQEWMGHADIQTTMKYLHYESPKEDAELVARAFATAKDSFDDSVV